MEWIGVDKCKLKVLRYLKPWASSSIIDRKWGKWLLDAIIASSTLLGEMQNEWSHNINTFYELILSTFIDCIRSSVASENLYVTGCQLRRSWSLEYERSHAEYVSDLRVSSSSSPSCWIVKNKLLVNIQIYSPPCWIMKSKWLWLVCKSRKILTA